MKRTYKSESVTLFNFVAGHLAHNVQCVQEELLAVENMLTVAW